MTDGSSHRTAGLRVTRPDGASERGLLPDSLSDRGDAKLFVALHGRTCRYVPGLGWYR